MLTADPPLASSASPGAGSDGKAPSARVDREERAPLRAEPRRLDERLEADLFAALLPFARRLRARQTRAGLVDFDGLLVRARDLLRDDLDVRASLKRRFAMILVDEFQDTDPIQYEIVFFLAEDAGSLAKDAYETTMARGACSSSATPSSRSIDFAAPISRRTGAPSSNILAQGAPSCR